MSKIATNITQENSQDIFNVDFGNGLLKVLSGESILNQNIDQARIVELIEDSSSGFVIVIETKTFKVFGILTKTNFNQLKENNLIGFDEKYDYKEYDNYEAALLFGEVYEGFIEAHRTNRKQEEV